MEEGKDGGWIKELGDTIVEVTKWIEEHKGSGYENVRLIYIVPVLADAVVNLEKRVSELEGKEEIERIIERGG